MLLCLALHPSCYSAAAAAAASSSSPLFVRPRFRSSSNARHLLPSSSPPFSNPTEANSPFHHLRRSCASAPSRPSVLRFYPRCASRSSPPPPPPPPGEDRNYVDGMQTTLTQIQDRLRIFFAVLFWMSLFFWASVYDGKNDAKKKGPWFRK